MKDFIYENATRIVFGKDSEEQLGTMMAEFSKKVLVVYGGGSAVRSGLVGKSKETLQAAGLEVEELPGVQPNPHMSLVYEGVALCKEKGIDGILAIGGGSVIDTCKAIAMGACYDGDAWDFFTGTVAKTALPIAVILTIPAAGSESSNDAVLTKEEGLLKRASCACEFLRPRFSILNPERTFSIPPYHTAAGATDMIAHVHERYWSQEPDTDLSDRLCEGIIRAVIQAAPKALAKPDDYASRAELMWAGTLAHNSLVGMGRSADWVCHGMGHEVSALYDATHGATLAVMIPAWMKYVYQENVQKFAQFANRVFDVPYMPGDEEAMALEGIARIAAFFKSIGMPSTLREFGVKEDDIPLMAQKCTGGNIIGGFKKLSKEDVENIYRIAF